MKHSPARWLMISLAFFATMINYLDRQALSVAAPVLREQFHMSNVAYSRVLSGFLLAYTVMNGVSGPLIDRLGTRLGYGLCVAWWSAAAVLHVFARDALSLGIFRFLLGIGEAGNWPAALKVVAEWFPARERALASGIFNSGSSAGAILAPPIVAFLLLRYGWQSAFLGAGLLGFVWLAFWWAVYRAPENPEAHAVPTPPAWQLFRTRFVLAFTISKIFFDPVWYFYIFWFPEYLKSARHFDMAAIGKYAWIPFLVAGAGNIMGGILSSSLIRQGMETTLARKTAVSVFALLMLAAIPAVLTGNAWASIAFVALAMTGYTGAQANMLSLPADVFPGNTVASVFGLASMGSGLGGMVFLADYGVARGPLFLHAGVLWLRHHAADLHGNPLDLGAASVNLLSGFRLGSGLRFGLAPVTGVTGNAHLAAIGKVAIHLASHRNHMARDLFLRIVIACIIALHVAVHALNAKPCSECPHDLPDFGPAGDFQDLEVRRVSSWTLGVLSPTGNKHASKQKAHG